LPTGIIFRQSDPTGMEIEQAISRSVVNLAIHHHSTSSSLELGFKSNFKKL